MCAALCPLPRIVSPQNECFCPLAGRGGARVAHRAS
jgi:hypothetical protein